MGRTSIAAVVTGALALLATAGPAHAEMYVVQVRRIDQDVCVEYLPDSPPLPAPLKGTSKNPRHPVS